MSRAPEPSDEDLLVEFVSTALEQRERGVEVHLDEICRARPDLLEQVSEALRQAPDLASLATEAKDFDVLRGRVLAGRYRLEQRIGAGAMGVVYRALDRELGRSVAVKLLRADLFGGDEAEARFLREAEVLAALNHESVVAVFDRGEAADGTRFLVMELLEGRSLASLLAELERRAGGVLDGRAIDATDWLVARLPGARLERSWLRQVVAWAADLAAGLQAAHNASIFHRDVKPSNVFVDNQGKARILDFGVAARSAQATLGTSRDSGLGTPAYMAPEQFDPATVPTPALDVYGLAATLYHMLVLRPPYGGSASQVVARIQRHDPEPVHRLRRGTPRDLRAILDRSLARRPGQRYASMAEFEADLRAFLAHQPVTARPLSVGARTWRRLRRSPTAGVLAAVLLVGLSLWAGTVWQTAWRAHRARRQETARAHMPPGLTLEKPVNRFVADVGERQGIRQLLDELVDSASDVVPPLALRAAFRFDQRDFAGAAADMADAAAANPTPVARELASRYRSRVDGEPSEGPVDVDSLPPPATLHDRYLIAYHTLRAERSGASASRAAATLDVPEVSRLPVAQELLGFALAYRAAVARARGEPQAGELYQRAYENIVSAEARRGFRTAASAQLLGAIHMECGRYEKAAEALGDGLRLAPRWAGLHANMAIVQRRLRMFDEAIASCRRATELRPSNAESYVTLARVYVDVEDFAAARRVVASVPVDAEDPGEAARHARTSASIELAIALVALARGRRELAAEAAGRAAVAFAAAGLDGSADARMSIAIRDQDVATFDLLVGLWLDDPVSWSLVGNVARTMPKSLTPEQIEALVGALGRLSLELAPVGATSSPVSTQNPPSNLTPESK